MINAILIVLFGCLILFALFKIIGVLNIIKSALLKRFNYVENVDNLGNIDINEDK